MQKTAYEMRISDWSSDVCSSDLTISSFTSSSSFSLIIIVSSALSTLATLQYAFIARSPSHEESDVAEDRKSVVEGKSVSVRVDLGGRRIIKKKIRNCTNTKRNNMKTQLIKYKY